MKNKNQYFPIIACPVRIRTSSAIFYLADKEIEVRVPKPLVNELLETCNGERTTGEIIEILGKNWQSSLVREFLDHLRRVGIICNSLSIGKYVWPFVKNPTRFVHDLSDKEILRLVRKAHKRHKRGKRGISLVVEPSWLQNIIERRCSTRVFSKQKVDERIVARLLWTGYGIVQSPLLIADDNPQQIKVWQKHLLARHTVPSAGALYPLRLSLVLLRPSESYCAGVYDVKFREHGLVELVLVNNDVLSLLRSFADNTVCNNAQGVIVISGSFDVSGEKYGNRSLLYVSLEAGHVAQNIHLSAAENNIGTVEIGGFLEEPMRRTLRLPSDYWPMITVVFGYPAELESIHDNGKDDIDVRWSFPLSNAYQLPFSMVFARLKEQKSEEWACGRAKEPLTAFSKASSEAYEWDACSRPCNLVRASLKEIDNAIDPRRIVRYHSFQYKRKNFPLKPFNENQKYFWKEGWDTTTGKMIYILSDCIYFPYTPETPRYTFANSSGTAAHPDWDEAVKCATLELIERDAFMVTWLNQLTMPKIRFKSLPQGIQKRIRALQKTGFRVIVKDFTLDLAPVVFVFAQNEVLPMTTCAGCSNFETTSALDHALMEVEAAAYCQLSSQNQPSKSISPQKVRYTDEHGNLYEQKRFFHRADFLADGKDLLNFADFAKNAPKNWQELMERFKQMGCPLITVDLSQKNNQERTKTHSIAKIFLPGIIPMSFGYGLEPCGMERVYTLPVRLGYQTIPTSYWKLTKFPHPYT